MCMQPCMLWWPECPLTCSWLSRPPIYWGRNGPLIAFRRAPGPDVFIYVYVCESECVHMGVYLCIRIKPTRVQTDLWGRCSQVTLPGRRDRRRLLQRPPSTANSASMLLMGAAVTANQTWGWQRRQPDGWSQGYTEHMGLCDTSEICFWRASSVYPLTGNISAILTRIDVEITESTLRERPGRDE